MRLNAHANLRQIARRERRIQNTIVAMPETSILAIERAADVCEAAEALLKDIRRHSGEDFTCPFIIALSTALAKVSDA